MQFCNQKGNFSNLNLRFACFVRSKMSIKGINNVPTDEQYKIDKKYIDDFLF